MGGDDRHLYQNRGDLMNFFEQVFSDIARWINEANARAGSMGMQSNEYWQWVMASSGDLCNKYQNHELVMMVMLDLVKWLEDYHKKMQ